MKIMKKAFAMFVAVFTLLATLCMVPVSAATTVAAQLYGRIEDNGQAIYKMVLDYGNVKVSGVDKDTYTVHAKTTTEGKRPADEKAYGDYDQDRTIVRVEEKGTKVEIYFVLLEHYHIYLLELEIFLQTLIIQLLKIHLLK